MSKKRKWVLILCAASIMVALGATLWYRHTQRVAAEQQLWNIAYEQAVERKNRAEADLVFNEENARRLLKETQAAMMHLDETTTDRKKAKADLQNSLLEIQQKLKHEQRIDKLDVMASADAGTAGESLKAIFSFKNSAYVNVTVPTNTTEKKRELWRINPQTRELKRLSIVSSSTAPIVMASPGKDSSLLLQEDDGLLQVNAASGQIRMLTFKPGKAKSAAAMNLYNQRLYLLDPEGNMIWKYAATASGYGQESTYLKQNTIPLGGATAMAIDANVYVGFQNGSLMRYLSGVEEVWQPATIDPPLENISSLWTVPETDRLVIADQMGKRIIVLNKDGQLISQIISPDFQGPQEVTGDPAAKKIYVLDGNRVIALDLP